MQRAICKVEKRKEEARRRVCKSPNTGVWKRESRRTGPRNQQRHVCTEVSRIKGNQEEQEQETNKDTEVSCINR